MCLTSGRVGSIENRTIVTPWDGSEVRSEHLTISGGCLNRGYTLLLIYLLCLDVGIAIRIGDGLVLGGF